MPDTTVAADPRDLLADLIARARASGADAADAILFEGTSLSLSQRLGKPEKLERSEGRDLGLRVFVGRRQAVVSTTDHRPVLLADLVERAVAMARAVPEDPFCGIADPDRITSEPLANLDGEDPVEPPAETLIERARAAEDAALAVAGVSNSEGAEAGWSRSAVWLAASNGFTGGYAGTRHSLSVSVIAGSGTAMEVDYDFDTTVHGGDLEDPAALGARAGDRAVRALNPRRMPTQKVPVVLDPRVSRGLLSSFAGAVNAASIARGVSFLKDRMGQRVFAPGITIVDDPFLARGLRSKPFDGEGIRPVRRAVIEDGVLTTWFVDLRSGRQLGIPSTGHASRGTSGPPSPAPTNLWLAAGRRSPQEIMRDVGTGFYVTRLLGHGANIVTGDYSRGAAGFWIEGGEIAHAVAEVTIAGNLKDMFATLEPASDLRIRFGTDAPTLLIHGMTVAGS
jgi:PmbA protein